MHIRSIALMLIATAAACDGIEIGDPIRRKPEDPEIVQQPLCESSGTTRLRRLTRQQYANTVRDLFGVSVNTDSLPADERTGFFYANTSAPVDDVAVDIYFGAGNKVAADLIPKLS